MFRDFLKGNNQEFLASLHLRNAGTPNRLRPGCTQPALDYLNQYFLTLVRLRTGMTEDVLRAIFEVSRVTVNRYYNCWIRVMDELFGNSFRKWSYTGQPAFLPSMKIRHLFPRVDLILGCFEIRIETPKNPDAARKCWRHYKKGYTVKVLGVECDGNTCFISHI